MALPLLYLAVAAVSTLWALGGLLAVWRVTRRVAPPALAPTAVSVLKPLCGVDPDLERNLEGFFVQDHPDFELVFGAQGADPALDLVRRLRDRHPTVPCRIVVHDGGRGLNPKVGNLRAMLTAARHDVVLISDSNIAAPPDYLRRMADELAEPGVGLVTSLFAGAGERNLGATLESLHLNGAIAGGIALPAESFDLPVAVGKSMMFRASALARLGGLESVAHVLAEDYVIGRMFDAAGYRVRLASQPVRNVVGTTTVGAFVRRHVRWGMIRVRLVPLAFLAEPATIPLAVALAAPLFGVALLPALAWAAAITIVRDAGQWVALRGPAGLGRALPLFPLRDALVLLAWVLAPLRRHVKWRGARVLVSAGTRLFAEREPEGGRHLLVDG